MTSPTLRRRLAAGGAALALAASLGACRDFLTGERLTDNPNSPITASVLQRLVAIQSSLFVQQEGQLARLATMYTQQLSGTNNQQQQWGSQYLLTEGDVNNFWNQNYAGGGLTDIRAAQRDALAASDQRTAGILYVIEALRMGTVTSLWGDIPYSQAVGDNTAPALDRQEVVYQTVQAKLDTAITLLNGTGGVPANVDLIFGANYQRWIRAANTIKARFHMHTGERLGAPAYQAAIAAASQGINEAPTSALQAIHGQAPGNLRAFHGNTINDANLWAQFLGNRADMTANQQFINLLQSRNDPRLPEYFDPNRVGVFAGANQFGTAIPAQGASGVDAATRLQFTFRQPIVTWSENQLILAEARFRTGDAAGALTNLNNVRTSVGLPALAGPVTLTQIAEEKYVTMFQNIEAYNDYKRNCYPVLTPGGANNTPAASIPARLPYGLDERNANKNIPAPGDAPQRNWNDPNAC